MLYWYRVGVYINDCKTFYFYFCCIALGWYYYSQNKLLLCFNLNDSATCKKSTLTQHVFGPVPKLRVIVFCLASDKKVGHWFSLLILFQSYKNNQPKPTFLLFFGFLQTKKHVQLFKKEALKLAWDGKLLDPNSLKLPGRHISLLHLWFQLRFRFIGRHW